MATQFNIKVGGIDFNILSMNAYQPKLFQVWVVIENQRKRFHLKQSEEGNLVFAMREDCPAELLAMENEIAAEVIVAYTSES